MVRLEGAGGAREASPERSNCEAGKLEHLGPRGAAVVAIGLTLASLPSRIPICDPNLSVTCVGFFAAIN